MLGIGAGAMAAGAFVGFLVNGPPQGWRSWTVASKLAASIPPPSPTLDLAAPTAHPDQRGDRQCRVGEREREVGRVQDGEGAPLVVGGQPLGQDGGDDVARVDRVFCLFDPVDPRQGPRAEPGRQVLHGGQQELFLGAEVVLDQPQGHARFGCDLAHPSGMQPARGGRPQQRVRDLPPPLFVIDPLRHPLTVPAAARPGC